jgi:predicted dehydrogenase
VRLNERLQNGEIGEIVGICATNRGRCPWGWFVQKELSGGGAMIDHTVHVADLFRVLLGKEPVSVQAYTGNRIYDQSWEDSAMLSLEFPGKLFATLDSSWSRPKSYKTWGDVTMNVVGERGVIELNMFSQAFDIYSEETPSHRITGFGSDLDAALIADFARCVRDNAPVPISMEDGWKAVQVALAGYESAQSGQPVAISS